MEQEDEGRMKLIPRSAAIIGGTIVGQALVCYVGWKTVEQALDFFSGVVFGLITLGLLHSYGHSTFSRTWKDRD
jgi:hypothetical protein